MQTFESVGRLLSFTASSQELCITQSAVSKRIQSLEEFFNFPLFLRDGNNLILTNKGQQLYDWLKIFLYSLSQGIESIQKGELKKRIAVYVPNSFASLWLCPKIKDFNADYPNYVLNVEILRANLRHVNHPYDCIVILGNDEFATFGLKHLFREELVPVCSPENYEIIKRKRSIENIPILHIIFHGERRPIWELWIRGQKEKPLFEPDDRQLSDGYEFFTMEQVLITAVNGFGVGMADINLASEYLADGRLKAIGKSVPSTNSYWVINNKKESSINFVNWLDKHLKHNN